MAAWLVISVHGYMIIRIIIWMDLLLGGVFCHISQIRNHFLFIGRRFCYRF